MKEFIKSHRIHLVVLVSTVFALVMNLLAIALPLNGRSTQAISDSFRVFFVPAGYVFSIWSVIYTAIIIFAIYQILPRGRKDIRLNRLRLPFILSNLLNGIWIIWWHYGIVELSSITMLLLLGTLIYIYGQIPYWSDTMGRIFRWTTAFAFSLYLGWISVATIANLTVQLYILGWNGLGLGGEYWAGLLCLVAANLAINLLWIRRDYIYASVIIWSLIGIFIKFSNIPALAITAVAAVGLIVLFVLYFLYKELSGWLKREYKTVAVDVKNEKVEKETEIAIDVADQKSGVVVEDKEIIEVPLKKIDVQKEGEI